MDVLAWKMLSCTAGNELQLSEITRSQSNVWRISNEQILMQNTEISSVTLSPDGRFALVNAPSPSEIQLWDFGDYNASSSQFSARCIQRYSMANAHAGKSRLIMQPALSSKPFECSAASAASRAANGAFVFCGGQGVAEDS
jgi:hypothetical protein